MTPAVAACSKKFSHQRSTTEESCYRSSHEGCAADSREKKKQPNSTANLLWNWKVCAQDAHSWQAMPFDFIVERAAAYPENAGGHLFVAANVGESHAYELIFNAAESGAHSK